jgi:hypothetical protein
MKMFPNQKKNLIISAVGDQSLHRHWISPDKNYDICLIHFGENNSYEKEVEYCRRAKGYKYHLIYDMLYDNDWLFEYEYIWLPDDDIYLEPIQINRLFEMMNDYKLELAQPSIMGWYGVEITLHQPGTILRFTNWVEIMCPCFSSSALRECRSVFKENKCGWSIESIWNVLLGHPQDKIAIIDDIVAIHTRPVLTGETHKGRQDPLEEATKEANEVYYKWNLDKEMYKDLKHGTATGGEIFCSVVYRSVRKPMEGGIPKEKRFWPPSPFLEKTIANITTSSDKPILTYTASTPYASVFGSRRRSGSLEVML